MNADSEAIYSIMDLAVTVSILVTDTIAGLIKVKDTTIIMVFDLIGRI